MHPDVLAARRHDARNNLQELAVRIAEKTGDEELIQQAHHINDRVPEAASAQAQELIQTERIVNVFKAALDEYDAKEAPVDSHYDLAARDARAIVHDASGAEGQPESSEEGSLEEIDGIGPDLAEKLKEAGYENPSDLKEASDEELLAIDGLGKAKLRQVRQDLK